MKVAVIGGVGSTGLLIDKLHAHGFADVAVWGYTPKDASLVSGWTDLGVVSRKRGYAFDPFVRVATCTEALSKFAPDVLFAVGLSQIIPPEMLSIARHGNIGFHPTALPKGRGRAAIAWLVLEATDGAASFFLLREGVDDGPILVQEPYEVGDTDDASTVEAKLLAAQAAALDRWLPKLAKGDLSASEQDHTQATWYGRRTPEDGLIDWRDSAAVADRLIRASTLPHPGAFTHSGDAKITIWKARPDPRPERGVPGRILQVADGSFTIQCGDGLLAVTSWESTNGWLPRVGQKLGYDASDVFRLRARCADLEARIAALESALSDRA